MSSSTGNQKVGRTWLKKLLAASVYSPPGVLYQNLDLPLNVFIRCLVHSDLAGLTISGKPTSEQITLAWASIYSQWIDANHENETDYILLLQSDVVLLTSHISETETCLYFLQDTYHDGLLRILVGNGYKPPTDYDNKQEWADKLQVIQNQLARVKMELASKIKEYDNYTEAHKNDEVTERYFTTALLRLAKYQGVAIIRSKDITVSEFVYLLQDYLNSIKLQPSDDGE